MRFTSIIVFAALIAVAWTLPAPQQEAPRRKISANPDSLLSQPDLNGYSIEKNFIRTNKEESPFVRIDETDESDAFIKNT
ncbi:hypothetical protein A0J61_09584 [Choanephora cucurbitarum]|uniref:Uncharacterized protein n=1 Tax=Choanephora cucurbitarum TaxID=101091 RepID=A0A1C7MZN8_9FUNG|nr:hypothetical protein A0J61_09584 [Choanephora cucurbitarum]